MNNTLLTSIIVFVAFPVACYLIYRYVVKRAK